MANETIGFIGLGLMGHGIARNIVEKGYGALPFGIVLGRVAAMPEVLPPRFPAGTRPVPSPTTTLAIGIGTRSFYSTGT